jgi:hypothetical protein
VYRFGWGDPDVRTAALRFGLRGGRKFFVMAAHRTGWWRRLGLRGGIGLPGYEVRRGWLRVRRDEEVWMAVQLWVAAHAGYSSRASSGAQRSLACGQVQNLRLACVSRLWATKPFCSHSKITPEAGKLWLLQAQTVERYRVACCRLLNGEARPSSPFVPWGTVPPGPSHRQ